MSQARSHVVRVLTEALPEGTVDGTTRGTAPLDGRVWVLQGSWSRIEAGPGETVVVIGAVSAGHHERLDTLTDQIFAALISDGVTTPSDMSTTYGDTNVIPGRESDKPSDVVTIEVTTPFDRTGA